MKRQEVKVIVESQNNPGINSALKMISEQYKSKEELIAIKALRSKFGRDTFLIDALIYDSLEGRNMIEPKPKVKKAKEAGKK